MNRDNNRCRGLIYTFLLQYCVIRHYCISIFYYSSLKRYPQTMIEHINIYSDDVVQTKRCLPIGHCVPTQSEASSSSPVQFAPPATGVGLSQARTRTITPVPHDTLQLVHSDQSPQPPSETACISMFM